MRSETIPRGAPRAPPRVGGRSPEGCRRREEEASNATSLCARPTSTTGQAAASGCVRRCAVVTATSVVLAAREDLDLWRRILDSTATGVPYVPNERLASKASSMVACHVPTGKPTRSTSQSW